MRKESNLHLLASSLQMGGHEKGAKERERNERRKAGPARLGGPRASARSAPREHGRDARAAVSARSRRAAQPRWRGGSGRWSGGARRRRRSSTSAFGEASSICRSRTRWRRRLTEEKKNEGEEERKEEKTGGASIRGAQIETAGRSGVRGRAGQEVLGR